MNKDQAIAFINALNALELYVAPILFRSVAQSDVCRIVMSVANGLVVCECRPDVPKAPLDQPSGP
jgi:hypothetical protein